jgi:hypothetical protein
VGGSERFERWIEHVKWQRATQVMLASAALSASTLRAADQPELDGDFLEFLGSIDAEAVGWGDYLERTEIATAAASPVAKPTAVKAPAPTLTPVAGAKPPASQLPQGQVK